MATYVDIVTALPAAGNGDKSLTRKALVKRSAYALDDSEDLRTITVVDPDYGSIPLYVIQQRRLFQYDSTDSTTAHDGTTCLVSYDGKRYKIDDYLIPWSVKSKTLTAPPGSPAIGDAYIVAVAGSGAWSGKDGQIATFTSRSWLFNTVPEGRHVYNEADGAFYFRNQTAAWIRGAGTLPFASGIVPLSGIIGTAGSLTIRVENQTLNAPPVSPAPSVGDAYIIGPAPTGAWAGNAAKVAICEDGVGFNIYTPKDGDVVYDKSLVTAYRWQTSTTSWVTASGTMKAITHLFATPGTATFSKDARSVMVHVTVIGGSGGVNGGAGTATAGGTSSFGSHLSATGSPAANSAVTNTSPGTGSGGDINLSGQPARDLTSDAVLGQAAIIIGSYGRGAAPSKASSGGGASIAWLLSSAIGTNETVTVGAAGAGGLSGTAGNQGVVIVTEWVLT